MKCTGNHPPQIPQQSYQPGEILIGGIVSHTGCVSQKLEFRQHPCQVDKCYPILKTKFYQHVLALVFAIFEINEDPTILPNITLGFHIHDSTVDPKWIYRPTLDLLFTAAELVPNYKCGYQKKMAGIIGGYSSETTSDMATLLSLYKIPQLSFGSFESDVDVPTSRSSFYRMFPKEALQYEGIVHLLLHFRWRWVGLITLDDERGDRFFQTLEPMLSRNGICAAFTEKATGQVPWDDISFLNKYLYNSNAKFLDSEANAIVVYGGTGAFLWITIVILMPTMVMNLTGADYGERTFTGKVWITTAQMDFALTPFQKAFDIEIFHGALSFSIHSKPIRGFHRFLQLLKPSQAKGDGFIKDFWEQVFDCAFPGSVNPEHSGKTCTEEEKLETVPAPFFEMKMTSHSYGIYNAVYALAHALHILGSSRINHRAMETGGSLASLDVPPWKLHTLLQRLAFNNSAGDEVAFNEHGELKGGFDITNMIAFPNKSYVRVKIGRLDPQVPRSQRVIIDQDEIKWNRHLPQVPPSSLCNENCKLGYSKRKKEGEKFCCYDCDLCPEGKMSDKEALVILSFIKYRDTPIVKANNRTLTYILLVSIFLSFLCSLLFIEQPDKVTCLLRQVTFAIIFSVAVSSVLAKTVTVIVVFMASKPGNLFQKWVGKELAHCIVISCSFVQVSICAVWLGSFPPFPDIDKHSLSREVIMHCNEGSVTMLYCALGYIGFLATICFIVAFIARKLPDSFNEAKFITFSMLVFCSVWLSFVPSYLSTKGKDTVAVEIFSILASSAGLLGCIFLPKCYVILLRPELNTRELLIRKKH
ncbi:vomeronasal type-2 receptor 26-like [Heteronotia binoei]|uniref:vomeronasal type-2 receptor 26-like n=1 Tax=Heteronotia binoei TaxID=13085 RepID=UPI0029303CF9|nr:vomeronasal type-2 receptor 26-like [Heteronotia binoei]